MEMNPYLAPEHSSALSKPIRPAQSWRPNLLGCLLVVAIIGVLVALLLPMPRMAGSAHQRMSCGNNLKQIGVALRLYADEYGALPPAYTVDEDGKALHSWRTLILPFMEQGPLYKRIDLTKPWDDPSNEAAYNVGVPGYSCPASPDGFPLTHTTYLAVTLPGGCFQATQPRNLSDIKDGTSQTIMVMEVDATQAVHWMSPTDSIDLAFVNKDAKAKPPHSMGFQAVFADCSVHFLDVAITREALQALITIHAKDDPGEY